MSPSNILWGIIDWAHKLPSSLILQYFSMLKLLLSSKFHFCILPTRNETDAEYNFHCYSIILKSIHTLTCQDLCVSWFCHPLCSSSHLDFCHLKTKSLSSENLTSLPTMSPYKTLVKLWNRSGHATKVLSRLSLTL